MIQEVAIVKQVQRNRALVETQVKTTCGSCVQQENCGTSSIAKVFANKTQQFWIDTPIELVSNDKIEVGIDEQCIVGASFSIYIIPIIAFFFGVLTVYIVFPTASELWQVMSGVLLSGLAYKMLKKKYANQSKDGVFTPVFIRKIEPDTKITDKIDITSIG